MPAAAWFPGEVHAEVVLGVLALAGLYVLAVVRSRRAMPLGQPLAFFAGCAAVLLALNGPLHDLSDRYLFSAHMVQHLVLTLVSPPLWLLGTPAFMLDGLLERTRALGTERVLRAATAPLTAFGAYAVALIAWHVPAPYNAALEHHGWHIVQHLTLMATGVLGWWPILSQSARAPALPYAGQLLYLFAFGMPMTVVAAMVAGAERVLYPFYATAPRVFDLDPLADQHLGGIIMWVPAGVIPLVAFTVVFFRWAAAERETDEA
jgi:putative membrane protein